MVRSETRASITGAAGLFAVSVYWLFRALVADVDLWPNEPVAVVVLATVAVLAAAHIWRRRSRGAS